MFYQKDIQMGFSDGYVERRIRKNTFFKQINMLIDWNEIEKEIKKVYKRDHSVLSRFRTELTEKKAFDRLFKKINRQLASHKVIIKNGVGIVDATLTDTPLCPKGKAEYELAEDRSVKSVGLWNVALAVCDDGLVVERLVMQA